MPQKPPSHAIVVSTGPSSVAVDATAAELVESYLRTLQSEKSRTTIEESFRRLARVATGGKSNDYRSIPWHRFDFDSLHGLHEGLGLAYTPTTANLTFTALRQMLRVGFLRGKVSQELLLTAQSIKAVKGFRLPKGRALTVEESNRFWSTCRGLPEPDRIMWCAATAVLLGAGARREEVCVLPVSGYVATTNELRIIGKGNKERAVPVDDSMRTLIEAWISTRSDLDVPHKYLFLSTKTRKPLSVWTLWFNIKGLAARAGCRDIAPHDFRRTFASRLLEAGFDLAEVQRLMGHSAISTTARYDKRLDKQLHDKRRVLNMCN